MLFYIVSYHLSRETVYTDKPYENKNILGLFDTLDKAMEYAKNSKPVKEYIEKFKNISIIEVNQKLVGMNCQCCQQIYTIKTSDSYTQDEINIFKVSVH